MADLFAPKGGDILAAASWLPLCRHCKGGNQCVAKQTRSTSIEGAARVHDYKKMNISHQLAWNLTDQAHSAAGEFSVSGVGSSDILGAARLAAREVSQSGVGSDLYGAARAAALEAGETCLKDLTTREASIMVRHIARFGN